MDTTIITLSEAARALNVNLDVLRHAVRAGRLPARRAGYVWLVTLDDVRNWQSRRPGHGGRPRKDRS